MDSIDPYLVARRVGRVLEQGVPPADLRSELYARPMRGVVTPGYFAVDPLATRISLAIALMGSSNVLGGWAALHVHGNTWFDGVDGAGDDRDVLVHCLAGSQLRVRDGIKPSEGRLHPGEVVDLGPYVVASMARAAYDEMRLARNVREAVVVLDMATSTTSDVAHTTVDDVLAVADSHHKTRGIVQARRALALGSPRSASPWETRTRLIAELDVGLSGLLVNVPVFDNYERLLGIADLIDPVTGLIIESDGGHHREAQQHTDDNVREELFERAGSVVCRVTTLDHRDRWSIVGRISTARRDAAATRRRDWTLVKPPWWNEWPPARRWA